MFPATLVFTPANVFPCVKVGRWSARLRTYTLCFFAFFVCILSQCLSCFYMLFVACLFGLFFCCFGIFVAHVFVCILFWALVFAVLGFFALTVSRLWVHIKYSYIHAHKPIITLYYYKNEPHVLLCSGLCMFFKMFYMVLVVCTFGNFLCFLVWLLS